MERTNRHECSGVTLLVESGKIYLILIHVCVCGEYNTEVEIDINFCPFCGKSKEEIIKEAFRNEN